MYSHLTRLHIARPVEEVFAALSDVTTHPRWQKQTVRAEALESLPLKVGSRLAYVGQMFGREMKMNFEVTAVDPPTVLAIRGTSGPVRPVNRMTLSSQDAGTLLESQTSLPSLLGLLIGRPLKTQQQRNLERLKELLESKEL